MEEKLKQILINLNGIETHGIESVKRLALAAQIIENLISDISKEDENG